MHRNWYLIAMATTALGLVALAADPNPGATPTTQPGGMAAGPWMLEWPAGFKSKELKEADDIRKSLGNIAEAAVRGGKSGFDEITDRLVDQDRLRFKDFSGQKHEELDQQASAFQDNWNKKYNQKFTFDTDDKRVAVFNASFRIMEGEVANAQTALNNWPVQPARDWRTGEAVPAAGREGATPKPPTEAERKEVEQRQGGNVNLEEGREVAMVGVPVNGNCPELHLSFIHERPDTWRIDLPNDITPQIVHDNLLRSLTWLNGHTADWPADVNGAYRVVSHRVFMSLYNVPETGGMMNKPMMTPNAPADQK